MKSIETLVLILVIFVFLITISYFGSEFIVKYVDMPFLLVFGLGIFFPPIWLLLLIYAIFKRLEEGKEGSNREHGGQAPIMSYYPPRRPYR
jgi:hypothetical protein